MNSLSSYDNYAELRAMYLFGFPLLYELHTAQKSGSSTTSADKSSQINDLQMNACFFFRQMYTLFKTRLDY